MLNDKFDLCAVSRIEETASVEDVNRLLSDGWKLLHIGDDVQREPDGTGYATVLYTLGRVDQR